MGWNDVERGSSDPLLGDGGAFKTAAAALDAPAVDFNSAIVFWRRRLGEAATAAAAATARPVLLARRDCECAAAPGGRCPEEEGGAGGLRRAPTPAAALLCSGRMDDVRDGVRALQGRKKLYRIHRFVSGHVWMILRGTHTPLCHISDIT